METVVDLRNGMHSRRPPDLVRMMLNSIKKLDSHGSLVWIRRMVSHPAISGTRRWESELPRRKAMEARSIRISTIIRDIIRSHVLQSKRRMSSGGITEMAAVPRSGMLLRSRPDSADLKKISIEPLCSHGSAAWMEEMPSHHSSNTLETSTLSCLVSGKLFFDIY